MDLHEEIKKVAYELYEKSGRIGGREAENWLAAEKIVMARHAQNEKKKKAAMPAVPHTSIKAPAAPTVQKARAQNAGPKNLENVKPGAKKTGPKKAAKKAK